MKNLSNISSAASVKRKTQKSLSAAALTLLIALAACANLSGCTHLACDAAAAKVQTVAVASTATDAIAAPLQYAAEPTRSELKAILPLGQALKIHNEFGDVRLRFGGFEHGVQITAVAQSPIGQTMPVVSFDAPSATISTALPDASLPVLGQRIDIVVWVPEKHSLNVHTLRGLVELRGVHSDVVVRSDSGDITARGVQGALDIETGSGAIEAAFSDRPVNAPQRVATRTGAIVVSFGPELNAELALATSALIATEYSVEITQKPGEEPNKTGVVKIGSAKNNFPDHSFAKANQIEISSKRGELRLFRRQAFIEAE